MPQVFKPGSNVTARVTIIISGLALMAIVLIASNAQDYEHRIGIALDQPAPFSHKHHVEELGIDCRYCHTTVEKSNFAGIPATETCMTCHSQIWTNSPLLEPIRTSYEQNDPVRWNRVFDAPDFVFFDHSIHIAKGVSCYTCHGPINEMNLTYKEYPLEMGWCLDCHEAPEKFVRPLNEVYNPDYDYESDHEEDLGASLVEQYAIQKAQIRNCWVCHR